MIYLSLTVIPSLIISSILTKMHMEKIENDYKRSAQWKAGLYANNIENFVDETVGRLEMLATLIKVQHNNVNAIEKIFEETYQKDPRFSGFYWASPEGDLLISSNPLPEPINISDRPYFKQALKLKKTTFSEAHIGRVTGRYIITIATPVFEDGEVEGFLLASLRLDKLKDSIKLVLEDELVAVTDYQGQTLFETGSLPSSEGFIASSFALEKLAWKITVKVVPEDTHLYRKTFFYNLLVVLIVSNILLLLIHNIRLKYKVKKEKEQNEYQKLELVGKLAASTAHEIRNPLTGISGLIKLLSEEYLDKKAQYYFEVIQKEIMRINAIVSELLVLGKPTAYTLKTYDLNEIVKEIEPIIQSEANYMNVQLSISYSTHAAPISCVKDHLKQVILNLSKNSLHSMHNGGNLTISLERNSEFCIINVDDTGEGISKDQLDQVFNPFFTMKKDGSGLGLTVCKRIIDSYGGDITIQSTVNEGTQVEVRIPLSIESVEKI